jgi:hypothetical protein
VEDLERRTVAGDAVVVAEEDYKDVLELGGGEVQGEAGCGREEGEEEGKECTRIHYCNVKQHQSQVHMNYSQRI